MLVRLDREVFAAAVGYVARTVPARPSQPLHAGLLLEVADGELRLAAGDPGSRIWARASVPAHTEPGRVLVPGRVLADVARALPDGSVQLEADGDQVVVTAGKSRFQLAAMPEAGYAAAPQAQTVVGVVAAAALADVVARVAFAAQADASVPALAGVHVEMAAGGLSFVATDRFRLAVGRTPWDPQDKATTTAMTVPARALADAVKGLAREGEVTVAVSGGELLTLRGATRATTLGALECDYPRWQALVPASAPTTAVVDAHAVAAALARVSVVKDHDAPVRLTFADGELAVASHDGGTTSGSDAVECALRGPGVTLGVNPHLLREGLLACGSERVRLELGGPAKPALVSPVDGRGYQYLVMPVRLQA